jgi:Flp pilus assembly protein TadG
MSRFAAHHGRRGTTAVEFALTCPIVFFLLFAIMIGGLGVFRYQQIAALAREGARWASVHGGLYASETGQPAATPADVYSSAIQPLSVALNSGQLSYSVTWDANNQPYTLDPMTGDPVANTVTVTVTYQWIPELLLVGPFTLNSTSTAQMSY